MLEKIIAPPHETQDIGAMLVSSARQHNIFSNSLDNVFVERLWRTVKYDYVYLNAPETGSELWQGQHNYFQFYNYQRPHQAPSYKTPASF